MRFSREFCAHGLKGGVYAPPVMTMTLGPMTHMPNRHLDVTGGGGGDTSTGNSDTGSEDISQEQNEGHQRVGGERDQMGHMEGVRTARATPPPPLLP